MTLGIVILEFLDQPKAIDSQVGRFILSLYGSALYRDPFKTYGHIRGIKSSSNNSQVYFAFAISYTGTLASHKLFSRDDGGGVRGRWIECTGRIQKEDTTKANPPTRYCSIRL